MSPLGSPVPHGSPARTPSSSPGGAESSTPAATPSSTPAPTVVASLSPLSPERPQTRLQHGIHKPKTYTDGTVRYGHLGDAYKEPTNLHDELSNPHWKNTMDHEYSALMKNKT
jgi:hypothetical protein